MYNKYTVSHFTRDPEFEDAYFQYFQKIFTQIINLTGIRILGSCSVAARICTWILTFARLRIPCRHMLGEIYQPLRDVMYLRM